MKLTVMIILILSFIIFAFSCILSIANITDVHLEKYETEARFENKLNKLLKKVTIDEWNFYRKIFFMIQRKNPKFWTTNYKIKSTGDEIFDVTIDKLLFSFEKTNGKCMCTGLNILGKKKLMSMNPPAERFEIYDLFVEYIMWKLYLYNKEQAKEKNKVISKEYQNSVKEANGLV